MDLVEVVDLVELAYRAGTLLTNGIFGSLYFNTSTSRLVYPDTITEHIMNLQEEQYLVQKEFIGENRELIPALM
jgi:hypothetical protein